MPITEDPTRPRGERAAPESPAGRSYPPRLDMLTPLRFVAAATIVCAHAIEWFGYPPGPWLGHAAGASLSFFFVLSGFVLAYNYPALDSTRGIRAFLALRFARLWPLHAFVFAALLATLPWVSWTSSGIHAGIAAIATVTLVQAWIPVVGYLTAFNGPAWTLSVDAFLYGVFPALLVRLRESPMRALLGAWLVSACGPMLVSAVGGSNAGIPNDAWNWHLFNHYFPPSRLGEFALGIVAAQQRSRIADRLPRGTTGATIIELAALAMLVAAAVCIHRVPSLAIGLGTGVADWLGAVSAAPVFAVAIAVFAANRGGVTRLLAHRACVHLGDLSYATYLLHAPLLTLFGILVGGSAGSGAIKAFSFAAVLLAAAELAWRLVEVPARRAIVGLAAARLGPQSADRR